VAHEKALRIVEDNSKISKTFDQSAICHQFKPGDQIDDFIILNQLGSGIAAVYRAEQKSMQRQVALKISASGNDEGIVLCNLHHSHIVRVFDERVLPAQRLRLLYMQYVAGGSLKAVMEQLEYGKSGERHGVDILNAIAKLRENRREPNESLAMGGLPADLDWTSVVSWLGTRLADALRYIHKHGYVHRDIKPANILLATNGSPLLADFNLSFGTSVNGARPEDCFGGTRDYMSPEHLEVFLGERNAKDVGPASDVYSLGIVLWEMAVGERPFPNESSDANHNVALRNLLQQRRQGVSPDQLPATLPISFRETLIDLLAPNPDDRPSAAELARALHLNSTHELRSLIAPLPASCVGRFTRGLVVIFFCSFGPNTIFALINILCNHRYVDIDTEQLTQDQNIVNPLVFGLGTILTFWFAWPVVRFLSRARCSASCDLSGLQRAVSRCLSMPAFVATVCMLLWLSTGIAYPIMNVRQSERELLSMGFMEFFSSQVVHGVIAMSITYLTMSLAAMRFAFPQLVRIAPILQIRPRLEKARRALDWHLAILGLTTPCSVMLVAWLSRYARAGGGFSLFVALGAFGAVSFGLALLVAPVIRSALRLLDTALTPLEM
jgi:serine/threonine protein kinase